MTVTELSYQLLRTELEFDYLLPPSHYPCYLCARVLPLDKFNLRKAGKTSYEGYRSCIDCHLHKIGYRRLFLELIIWIACMLVELSMPPAHSRLRSPTENTVRLREDVLRWHMQNLRKHTRDYGNFD